MSNKLLIISGPTATGKTALAVKLAKKYHGELISADSRQIYLGMDIGTGKDRPADVKLHLIDIVNPDKSFSVVQYRLLAIDKIKEILLRNKLPIIVGGTGQYIDSITNPQSTFHIKPNKFLRLILNKLSLRYLQYIFKLLDKNSFETLNNSEKNNPHRLIRKIEITLSRTNALPALSREGLGEGFDILHLSLTAPNPFLYSRIDERVKKRLKSGLIEEIKNLLETYQWSSPGLNSLAYKEFKTGFSQKNIDIWQFNEHSYARRQKTWFKKITPITFIDISKSDHLKNSVELVDKWYNNL